MRINWKVRFRNPVWLTSFIAFIISTVYQFLAMLDIAPTLDESSIMQVVSAVIQVLTLLGILQDPTTKGIGDSERALNYEKPRDDGRL